MSVARPDNDGTPDPSAKPPIRRLRAHEKKAQTSL